MNCCSRIIQIKDKPKQTVVFQSVGTEYSGVMLSTGENIPFGTGVIDTSNGSITYNENRTISIKDSGIYQIVLKMAVPATINFTINDVSYLDKPDSGKETYIVNLPAKSTIFFDSVGGVMLGGDTWQTSVTIIKL